MPAGSPFYDLPRLLRIRSLLSDADPSRPPCAIQIAGAADQRPARLALLPGSFNPPTNAHVALADLAQHSGRIDQLWYLLASRTVDKERVEGATLADRLICLTELVRRRARQGVVLVNRGLYVDQAELVRQAMPYLEDLWFVVGFDKIVQIFDRRYYRDRDVALDRLFSLASFLVSPRAPARPEDLDAFLDRPENRRYRGGVTTLGLSPRYQRLSSTRVRTAALQGQISAEVPPIVTRFIAETGAYEMPARDANGCRSDRYGVREDLVELAERGQLPQLEVSAFHRAVEQLAGLGAEAQRRRTELARGDVAGALGTKTEQIR